jgi:urease accessory protein
MQVHHSSCGAHAEGARRFTREPSEGGAGLTTLLILADGRLPAGGHAHSGGLEAAVATGRVHDLASLEAFLRGRLATSGLVSAAFAAATTHRLHGGDPDSADHTIAKTLAELDDGLDARTPSPALRHASRTLGRALLRAGRAMWAIPGLPNVSLASFATLPNVPLASFAKSVPRGPHHPVALGVVAAAAGLQPVHAALVAAYGSVSGPASAAVRLLALDPYPVHALLARLAYACDDTATRAAAVAGRAVDELPAASAPLLDIAAEHHATWEVRLFAS